MAIGHRVERLVKGLMQPQTQIPIKDTLYDRLFQSKTANKSGVKEKIPPFHEWVEKSNLIVDGRPFTYKRHEYLKPVYRDEHPFIVWMKATQGGATLWAILRTIYKSRYKNIRGVLYLFPSRTDVSDFSRGRVDPLIDENPDNIGLWIRDTDQTNMKRIWNSFLYLRGMKSRVGLKCHDNKTEVLTGNGWKSFSEITINDQIATRSPSGIFMWQKPTEIYRYPYNGKMLEFLANGLDFCVTTNHRLLLTSDENKKREWIEIASEAKTKNNGHTAVVRTCKDWDGVIPSFIKRDRTWSSICIPGNPINNRWPNKTKYPDRLISLRDFVAFLGIYVAEGSCNGVMSGERSGGRISISQVENSPYLSTIRSLLERIGGNWRYNGVSFRVGDVEFSKILFPIGNKYNRSLPSWVINLPRRYLEVLWKWALMGDGHIQKKGNRKPHRSYATVSKKLADQFQEILQKCGRSASILIQKESVSGTFPDGRKAKGTTPLYLVSERQSRCSILPEPKEVEYDGEVFCVSVPNGVIYTRRNGYALWSGNSLPVDLIIFDELDEAVQSMVDMAMERMAHAEDGGEVMMLSNPTLPEYGIDKAFYQTDQRYWLVKCSRCNEYHNLVDEFPNCFHELRNGNVIRACVKCGKELNPAKGQYVSKRPDVTDKIGYHYSQLYSQFPASDPKKILHLFKTTSNLREFYNLKIGIPYAGKYDSLSIEEVLALCDTYDLVLSDSGPCYMGVDQGKDLHVVIGKWLENKLGKIIYLGIHKDFSELDTLMNHFNVSRCVIDWEPNIHESRKFAERFGGRVFCHKYNEFYRGPYKWDEEKLKVTTNRTDSLDASAFEIQNAEIILPSKQLEIVKTFAQQLHNIIKKLEIEKDEDGVETGNKRYVYVRRGEDHFRHALNYETMARQYTLDLAFPWMQ